MSKVFYDSVVDLSKVEHKIKKIAKTDEERRELYELIDEIVHHRVLGAILDRLPEHHHGEFLDEVAKRPHDENLLKYLGERIKDDVVEFIRREIHGLAVELLLIVERKTHPKQKLISE